MNWQRPTSLQVWKAIDIYLRAAYDGSAIPSAVRSRLETLHSVSEDGFFDSNVWEHQAAPVPARFCLRMGNRFYPHMKLCVERSPDGKGHLFRADSHDRHCAPPAGSPEYPMFCQLVENNQAVCQTVEAAWEAAGLATFKSYLKEDLARRKGGEAGKECGEEEGEAKEAG